MNKWIGLIVAVGLLLSVVPAAAHEGHEHKILGTVTMAAADHVMVKDRDGKGVTVYIAAATKVTRNKQSARVDDITVNMRVVVTAVTEKEKMIAKTIELGPAPKN